MSEGESNLESEVASNFRFSEIDSLVAYLNNKLVDAFAIYNLFKTHFCRVVELKRLSH